jgi:hypothetical protein
MHRAVPVLLTEKSKLARPERRSFLLRASLLRDRTRKANLAVGSRLNAHGRQAGQLAVLGCFSGKIRTIPFLFGIGWILVVACAAPSSTNGTISPAVSPPAGADDTTGKVNVPVGFGSLRQDDIAIRLQPSGMIVRAIPLDENVIRLLTQDSYRALRDLQESNRPAIERITRRSGGRRPAVWYVSFYGLQPEARFSPMELVITSAGQDFRPIDVIPLSSGFGEQRLRQRETQSAVYLYSSEVDVDHPLVVTFQGERDTSWEQILQRIERERALVRARSSGPASH